MAKRYSQPRSVLITGATGGIGSALAEVYAEPQQMLVLQGRHTGRLHDVARRCQERGAMVQSQTVDLRDRVELARWLDAVGQMNIDLAIVNAGVTSSVGMRGAGESWDAIENVIDVNIRAAMAIVSNLLPSMRQHGRGQIALISSLSAYYGLPITPAYCASKAALKAYGESLRGWLAPEGIAINVVLPGFVATAMSAQFPGPKAFVLRPEAAARIIRRGLVRNQARIAFPFPLNLGMWSLSVLPPAISQRILRAMNYGGASRARRGSA